MRSAILAIAASALFLCSCQVNTVYDRGAETAATHTALTQSPKRAQGSYPSFSVWLCAPSNYVFTGNFDEGFPVTANNIGLIYLADQGPTDYFTLINTTTSNTEPFDIYWTDEVANTQEEIKGLRGWTIEAQNLNSYNFSQWASSPVPYICIVPTNGIGEITIHNEKPTGAGPVNVMDENLDYLVSVMPSQSGSLDRLSILTGETILTTDSVLCNIGTASGGSDVASSIRNYTITLDTPNEIYVSSDAPYFTIQNNTAWDMTYYKKAILDITEDDSGYNLPRYWGTLDYTPDQPITIVSTFPFSVSENGQTPQVAQVLGNLAGNMYEGIEGMYGVQFPASACAEGSTLTISASTGQDTNVLWGTFSTIAQAFTALIPLLSIQVFNSFTIGSLMLIPFTFALIVLLFKLIKK